MSPAWKRVQLKEICELDKAKHDGQPGPYVGLEHIESNTGRFIGDSSPVSVKSSTFQFGTKHILYGRLRPYLNKAMIPHIEGHCSTEIFPIRTRRTVDRKWLFYWLTSKEIMRAVNDTCTGARMPRANMNQVMNFELLLPELAEQKRIVAILDEAFAGIETAITNTEKNLANARELFESYADLAVRGLQGVQCWLKDCVEQVSTGPFGSLLHKSDYVSDGLPLVNPINIVDSRIVADDRKCVAEDTLERLSSYVLKEGDVVVARRGEIGRCAVVEQEQDGWLCGTGCFFVRPKKALNPHFLVNLLRSETGRSELLRRSTGATMKNLGNKALSTFEIRLPPREEQDKMIEELTDLQNANHELTQIFRRKLASLKELKQSLLQKAFSGELTADRVEEELESATA